MKKSTGVVLLLWAALLAIHGQEIIYNQSSSMGIAIQSPEKNPWQSRVMRLPEKTEEMDLKNCGQDFFEDEFGESFVFNSDLLMKYSIGVDGKYAISDGKLNFSTGDKGWGIKIGENLDNPDAPQICIGSRWVKNNTIRRFFLQLEIEQDKEETCWNYYSIKKFKRKTLVKQFKVKGVRPQIHLEDINGIYWDGTTFLQNAGFQLYCTTPNANIKIRSIKLVPMNATSYWRKTVDVPFEPVMAKLSCLHQLSDMKIRLNGHEIAIFQGDHKKEGVETYNLMPYLQKGENVITIENDYVQMFDRNSSLALEGIIVGKEGETVRITGDKSWKCTKHQKSGWEKLEYNDSAWKTPELGSRIAEAELHNKTKYFNGWKPAHMGVVEMMPVNRKYPIFDFNEPEISYEGKIPAGMKDIRLVLRIVNAESRHEVEKIVAKKGRQEEKFQYFSVNPRIREPGAYWLFWTLEKDGKTFEERKDEMIISGPIKQDEYTLNDFEKELESRLELMQHIDCTKAIPEEYFADHNAGVFSKPQANVGHIVSKHGMTYRETGPGLFDWFAYKLNITTLGTPMMLEVIVPDNEENYVYASVEDSFSGYFSNNSPDGQRGWPNTSASSYSGGIYPFSKGKKKLRFLFWPSTYNSCVMISNGLRNKAAAVCEINMYRLKNGIPALKLPFTNRVYGYHNERIFMNNLSCDRDFRNYEMNFIYNQHDNAWVDFFIAAKRKIEWMRFQGHNASVEGIYMYNTGYPSPRFCKQVINDEFDAHLLMMRLFKHNGLKYYVGMEIDTIPEIEKHPLYGISSRKIWQEGKQGLNMIDRFGIQSWAINPFHPATDQLIKDLITDIYSRYKTEKISGIVFFSGLGWLPGIPTVGAGDRNESEIGFDDATVAMFERDNGIKLAADINGRGRFEQRYTLLNGKYRNEWNVWRAKKILKQFEDIRDIVNHDDAKWHVYISPCLSLSDQTPFSGRNSKKTERDLYWQIRYEEAGFILPLYRNKEKITLLTRMWDFVRPENDADLISSGMNRSKSIQGMMKETDAAYFHARHLNEVGFRNGYDLKTWYWKFIPWTTYQRRPTGDAGMAPQVNTIADYTPKVFFDTWLDVNITTAHGDQSRRFLQAFYTTPELPFIPTEKLNGIQGEIAGNYLRVVNNTAYPIKGLLSYPGNFRDLIYDKDHEKQAEVMVPPYTILIFRAEKTAADFEGRFRFNEETESQIKNMAFAVFNERALTRKINKIELAKLRTAYKNDDIYRMKILLDGYEISFYAQSFMNSQKELENQKRLLAALTKNGVARINAACSEDYFDLDGNLWLPDQPYKGFSAYGNEYANYVDRGSVGVKNSRAPRMHQTEAYGTQIYYYIPVPNGHYDVKVHFAELFQGNKDCGRLIKFEINKSKKDFDVFKVTGGFGIAGIIEWQDMNVEDEMLAINIQGGCGINGIEIIKK